MWTFSSSKSIRKAFPQYACVYEFSDWNLMRIACCMSHICRASLQYGRVDVFWVCNCRGTFYCNRGMGTQIFSLRVSSSAYGMIPSLKRSSHITPSCRSNIWAWLAPAFQTASQERSATFLWFYQVLDQKEHILPRPLVQKGQRQASSCLLGIIQLLL